MIQLPVISLSFVWMSQQALDNTHRHLVSNCYKWCNVSSHLFFSCCKQGNAFLSFEYLGKKLEDQVFSLFLRKWKFVWNFRPFMMYQPILLGNPQNNSFPANRSPCCKHAIVLIMNVYEYLECQKSFQIDTHHRKTYLHLFRYYPRKLDLRQDDYRDI